MPDGDLLTAATTVRRSLRSGSGPARALARREPLFDKLAYTDRADSAVLVLESAVAPPPPIVDKVARTAGLHRSD